MKVKDLRTKNTLSSTSEMVTRAWAVDPSRYVPIEETTSIPPADVEDKPIEEMTVAQLRAYANMKAIDLGVAKKREEILAAINAASASVDNQDGKEE